jgi:hypothetical protein
MFLLNLQFIAPRNRFKIKISSTDWRRRHNFLSMEDIGVSPFLQNRGIISTSGTFVEDPLVVAQSIGRGKAPHPRRPGTRISFSVADMSHSVNGPRPTGIWILPDRQSHSCLAVLEGESFQLSKRESPLGIIGLKFDIADKNLSKMNHLTIFSRPILKETLSVLYR